MSHHGGSLARRFLADPLYFCVRAIDLLRARFLLRRSQLGPGVGASGRLIASLEGTCRIARKVTFRGGMIPTCVRVQSRGVLEIGESCVFNYGVSIEVHEQVRIGARCMVASMVRICDCDGDLDGPVFVGDDVWIAHGALIQPGVTIGDGSVIAAGSVVTMDVPPRSLASGNPARSAPLALVAGEDGSATSHPRLGVTA